ncbi:MAG: serine protease [Gemmatimonadota bacterium]
MTHLRWRSLLYAAVILNGAPVRPLGAQDPASSATPAIFRRYSDHVSKIQVSENASGAKSELGSGFFVSDDGLVITNYHVISKLVLNPDRYHAELFDTRGTTRAVTVVAIDVVHDLAVLRTEPHGDGFFNLIPVSTEQGTRLYSLGHPHDLGLSIVEGTYNGLLQHTLYQKIHFTGSLNPGMSGGPTIDDRGEVVGVNVSTAGNQLSFLVPVDRAMLLLRQAQNPDYSIPDNFLAVVAKQLLAYQDVYLATLLADSGETTVLGHYRLPTNPASFFNCWADADRNDDSPYEVVDHQCSTDDYVFISGEHSSGVVEFEHRLLSSKELNRFRFFSLFSDQFRMGGSLGPGDDEDVTPYRCESRPVNQHGLTMKVLFCVRRYRKMTGLYDAVVKAAVLGERDAGLLTTLNLSGVSFENAEMMARRYLGSITWNP